MKRWMFHCPEPLWLLKVSMVIHAAGFIIALLMHTPHGLSYFTWRVTSERLVRQWVVFIWVFQHGVIGALAYFIWQPFAKWTPYVARLGRVKTVAILALIYGTCVFLTLSISALFTWVLIQVYPVPDAFILSLMRPITVWSLFIGIGMGHVLKPLFWMGLTGVQGMIFWLEPDLSFLHGWWPQFFLSTMDHAPMSFWQVGTLIMVGLGALGVMALRKDLL